MKLAQATTVASVLPGVRQPQPVISDVRAGQARTEASRHRVAAAVHIRECHGKGAGEHLRQAWSDTTTNGCVLHGESRINPATLRNDNNDQPSRGEPQEVVQT